MARVLVIDDERDVRWLLRMSLERVGHEVILAEDGLRGVAMAQRQRPDVIVLDLMMPVMDGYGVLDALAKDGRRRSPSSSSQRGRSPRKMLASPAEARSGS